jgi:hypothetical protein
MTCLLALGLVLVTGCRDEEEFSRYPSVDVPEYSTEDYLRDLSDPNPERVYNAICNLGNKASSFGKTLCAENADPDSAKYLNAERAYHAVRGKLDSKNPQTVAVSLRFLQLFVQNYKPKGELLEIVSGVESKHPLVQFEQVALLTRLVGEDARLPEPLLLRLLDSPSWIVSRTTYGLIGQLPEEPLRQELVRRCQVTDDKWEHLILINALGCQSLQPEEVRMFEEQMLAAEDPDIRMLIGQLLACNADTPEERLWFRNHYPQFSAEEREEMFSMGDDIELRRQFIAQGYVPDDGQLKRWAKDLMDDGEQDNRAELLQLDQALKDAPQLAGHWQTLNDEVKAARQRKNALRKEMEPISSECREKTEVLLTKHGIPPAEQKKILEKISKTLTSFTDN